MDSYEKQAKQLEEQVLKFHNCKDGWHDMKPQKGVKISYRQSPHFNGSLYRFECEVDVPDDILFGVMKPALPEEKRDHKCVKQYVCLKQISDDKMIGLVVTHPVMFGLVSTREFLDLYYFRPHQPSDIPDCDRISWIFAQYIEDDIRPVTKKYIRARNYPTGYAVVRCKSDPNKSRLILYVNCDVSGALPQSLVEAALPWQQLSNIESVKEQAKKAMGKK